MTTAHRSPAAPRRRRTAALPRAIAPRNARPTRARQPANRPSRSLRRRLLRLLQRGAACFGLATALLAFGTPASAQNFGDADPGIFSQLTPIVRVEPEAAIAPAVAPPRMVRVVTRRPTVAAPVLPIAQVVSATDNSPRSACLEAARRAEARHDLPEGFLVAIALNESGLHAYALSIGGQSLFPATREEASRLYRAGVARTAVMAGCVQVNARVHARQDDWPLDPERATDWAGQFLRAAYARSGSWAEAVRIWHGGGPGTTTRLACRIRAKMDVTAPLSGLFSDRNCGGGAQVARLRRNGEAHLQIAQVGDR